MKIVKLFFVFAAVLGLNACGSSDSDGGGGEATGAEAGCYVIAGAGVSFEWAGGTGPHIVQVFEGASCTGTVGSEELFAVGSNMTQAVALCGTDNPEEVTTAPPAPEPYRFFGCI